jgi:hypothetical protein
MVKHKTAWIILAFVFGLIATLGFIIILNGVINILLG